MSKDGQILLMLMMILILLVAAFCILRKSTGLKSFYKWTGMISRVKGFAKNYPLLETLKTKDNSGKL